MQEVVALATRDLQRDVLLGAGRASMNVWLRHLTPHDPTLRAHARAAYDEASQALPWPKHPVLKVHLAFSVLPGAAIYRTLMAHGYTSEAAAAAVTRALTEMAQPRHAALKSQTRGPRGQRLFMRIAQRSLVAFPSPGWEATWVQRTPHCVAFDMTRCFDLDMLRLLDATAIAPAYCAVDDVLYTDLCPQLRWQRTGTLATGAISCDFRFDHLPTVGTPVRLTMHAPKPAAWSPGHAPESSTRATTSTATPPSCTPGSPRN